MSVAAGVGWVTVPLGVHAVWKLLEPVPTVPLWGANIMMLLLKMLGCSNVAAPVGPRMASINLLAISTGYGTTLDASAAAGALPGVVS
jgi:hypothetical protein